MTKLQKTIHKKILVVEDEISLLQALNLKLTKEGFHVLSARNGQEGLDVAFKEHPDLILLDIIMPIMDGMTMLKKLREDARGRDIPVFILTNLTGSEKVADALDNESFDFLVKSDWKLEDVVKKVKEKLEL